MEVAGSGSQGSSSEPLDTVSRSAVRIEKRPHMGLRLKREPKQLLRGDTAAQAAWYKAMRETGVYSVDDIRALEDLPDVPGGDGRSASLNYVPLEDWRELSRMRALQGKQQETKPEE